MEVSVLVMELVTAGKVKYSGGNVLVSEKGARVYCGDPVAVSVPEE